MFGKIRLFPTRLMQSKFIQVKMADTDEFRIDEINGLLMFLKNIEWKDPWLVGLIIFHIVVTVTTILTRNYGNIQVALFLVLYVMTSVISILFSVTLVYFSESINELASNYWNLFSRQQYFDSKGMFISLVFSAPILLNCMVLVASWLYQSSQLMTKLKQAQLRAQFSKQNQDGAENSEKYKKFTNHVNSDLLNRLRHRPVEPTKNTDKSDQKVMDATGIKGNI